MPLSMLSAPNFTGAELHRAVNALIDAAPFNVRDFGATGGPDDTAAVQAAIDAAAAQGGGVVFFPAGTWRVNYASLASGVAIKGVPRATILRPVSANDRAILTADSGSASSHVSNLLFEDIIFAGAEAAPTFSEQDHLVTLNGVSEARFNRCQFIGWRGDALYFGSGDSVSLSERHNRNVHIRNCRFDGVNRQNRQAISCVDIDGIIIEGCTFENTTADNMPGTLDFEPNPAGVPHVIRNVWVRNNRFRNCGGNVGTVTLYVPNATLADPTNFQVVGNEVEGSYVTAGGGFVAVILSRLPTATSAGNGIVIRDNYVDAKSLGSNRPYQIFNGKGVTCEGNTFQNTIRGAVFGWTTASAGVRNLRVRDRFVRVGSGDNSAVALFGVSYADLNGCAFEDCGDGSATAAAIAFAANSVSDHLRFRDITVTAPTGKTLRATRKEATHTLDPLTNEWVGNDVGSLAVDFQAVQSDALWTAFTPVAEGATTVGTGTYTTQKGVYRRRGNLVDFQIEVAWSAHTGAGLLEVGLPTPAANVSAGAWRPVTLLVSGVATTGGHVGLINPGASVGSNGAIRCYSTASGTMAQTAMPVGAVTVYASGTYTAT